MTTILSNVLSIFLIIAAGFAASKAGIIKKEADKHFVTLIMSITMPCMIITSIMATAEAFILGTLFFVFTFILGYLICKKVLKVSPKEDLGVYVLAFSSINNGFMGFPITQAIFGNDILYFMILHNIMLNLYLYSAGPFILNMNSEKGKFNIKYFLKTLCNPSTAVSAVSIVMLFSGLHLPPLAFDTLDLIGSITVPLSMLLVGVQLADSNIARIIKNRHLLAVSVIKMISVPILTFLAINWLPVDTYVKIAIIFGGAFPTAVITSAITAIEGKNSLLAAETVALTTLLSIAVIPAAALLLTSYYGL